MNVRVNLFAQMRRAAGAAAVDLELPSGATLGQALETFYEAHPRLGGFRSSVMTAVGLEYAAEDHVLTDGEEISLIPPVQGG